MPGPLRIALVAEGKTEHEVIEAALDTILAPRRFVLTLLQPEATRPDLGTGWGGVLKWCQQLMARHDPTLDPAVESDPLLCSFYDGVVLHLDADVATFAYTDLSLSHTVASVAAKGWLPLPCVHACPPAPLPGDALHAVLSPDLILFGEWCAARHSLDYTALPDWLLLFDVYDRRAGQFWSTPRRNALACSAGLATVPKLAHCKTTVAALQQRMTTTSSRYRQGPLEGVVVRRESAEWCEARAKLVRPDFTQAIETHWRKRAMEWNRVR